jgi:hypothetical protein
MAHTYPGYSIYLALSSDSGSEDLSTAVEAGVRRPCSGQALDAELSHPGRRGTAATTTALCSGASMEPVSVLQDSRTRRLAADLHLLHILEHHSVGGSPQGQPESEPTWAVCHGLIRPSPC